MCKVITNDRVEICVRSIIIFRTLCCDTKIGQRHKVTLKIIKMVNLVLTFFDESQKNALIGLKILPQILQNILTTYPFIDYILSPTVQSYYVKCVF